MSPRSGDGKVGGAAAAPAPRAKRSRGVRTPLGERIASGYPGMTPSSRRIASYMLANEHLLPFEHAAAIAAKVGVSAMTVGRFLRSLGYGGFGQLKNELRGAAVSPGLLVSDRLDRIRGNDPNGEALHDNLQLEVNALIAVYEQVGTPLWKQTVARLAASDQVFVAGFQTLGGLAADFAARLQYLRSRVGVLDGRDGTFAELLAGSSKRPCLVLFEMRRYTRFSQLLAQQCRRQGIPVVIICDSHCHWARDCSDAVFTLNTESNLFWDAQAPFLSFTNLLLDHVVRKLGHRTADRLKSLRAFQDRFGVFVG
jgi:DNA-binding MurR/RpiR family transcriptional regulator